MDTKDRIDNFLKVARTKLLDEHVDKYVKIQLNELKCGLAELTADHKEKERLLNGYSDIIRDAELATWDEKFLGVIAGEKSPEVHLDEYTRLVSRGRSAGKTLTVPNQYTGQIYPTASGTASLTMGKVSLSELELAAIKKLANENKI